jgi:RimJ/RimL family protein N-acetyltransferase
MKDTIEIKQLTLENWPDLKIIRLDALNSDPSGFLSSYAADIKKPDQHWQRSFENAEKAIFGVYDGADIIGMGGLHPEKYTQRAARLGGGYIKQPYRGRGLGRQLLQIRIDWARASGLYDAIYVSHRQGNVASQAMINKAGFSHHKAQSIAWPDGQMDDELIYRLTL